MKVRSESEVVQSCPTCSDPMDCSPPGSSVHGIFQARVLEWGAIAFSGKVLHKAIERNSLWIMNLMGFFFFIPSILGIFRFFKLDSY